MGVYKDKFMKTAGKVVDKYDEAMTITEGPIDNEDFSDYDDNMQDPQDGNEFDNVEVQSAQKPKSFFEFILSNKFHDIELMIRGYKKVFNRRSQQWETKRKENHCFTDEESENIVRMAESHLSPDIKLSYISINVFPVKMLAIKEMLDDYFYNIADYKYGRYGDAKKQFFMKQENHAIFVALMERIQANYSMAIKGAENKHTHNSVRGQESLSGGDEESRGIY